MFVSVAGWSMLISTSIQFIAFAAGYLTGDISLLLWTGLGGAALTFLVTIPPWPTYNKHAVRWLPPLKGRGAYNVTVDGQKIQ